MKIEETRTYTGRNIYSHKKCIKMVVNLEGYSEIPSKDIHGFNDRLVEMIPELGAHRCGIDEDGGFVKRLKEGTYLAHICEHILIALQNKLGLDVCYGKAREMSGDSYYVIYEYVYERSALECGRCAVDLINALITGKEFNINHRIFEIKSIMKKEELGPSTFSIIDEAKKRGIPAISVGDGSMYQLGYGKSSRLIEATIGGNTSAVAVDIACDKLLAKETLYNQCLPIADGGKVRNPIDLLIMADRIGYPVVLKPQYGNQGKGVLVNIKDQKELVKAYNVLSERYGDIMIEKYIEGRDYRVCVVDGTVLAVAERIPPFVSGDGRHTVKELIDMINEDDKRGEGHERPLTKIKINEELLSGIHKCGYELTDVLPKNKKLVLRENANLSTGGTAIDCTDEICRENVEMCERCAKAIGLDICGIDVCCKDISEPIGKSGAIIEVNAAPGIRMHHFPYSGKPRNVAGAIVDMLFKNCDGQIPIIAVTGTNGKTTTTRLIAHALKLKGLCVGATTTGGIYVNDSCVEQGDTTGYESALTVLMNKDVEAAVLECARGGIIRNGLAYDLADVGIITNITEDHLGLGGVETLEDLAYVKSLVGEAVKKDGYAVLNADDPMSMTIVDRMKNGIIMFSKNKNNDHMRRNMQRGGIAIYADEGFLFVEDSHEKRAIMRIDDIPITMNGILNYNVENALAACAGLIGLGVEEDVIRQGLATFHGDEEFNPGRFNIYDVNGAKVVLDYGHNIQGYKAVLDGARRLQHKRLVGVIGVPGDRTDSSVLEVGRIAGENFDYMYVKEDVDKRGRRTGEIAEMLKKGALSAGFDSNNIEIILNEVDALRKAVDTCREGDIIIIFFEHYEPLLELVKEYLEEGSNDKMTTLA